jgi:hypothetical protein
MHIRAQAGCRVPACAQQKVVGFVCCQTSIVSARLTAPTGRLASSLNTLIERNLAVFSGEQKVVGFVCCQTSIVSARLTAPTGRLASSLNTLIERNLAVFSGVPLCARGTTQRRWVCVLSNEPRQCSPPCARWSTRLVFKHTNRTQHCGDSPAMLRQ